MKKQYILSAMLLLSISFTHGANPLRHAATRHVASRAGTHACAKAAQQSGQQQRKFSDIAKFFLIVNHAENRIIERFGEFNRVVQPGLRFKVPFVENTRKIQWSKAENTEEHKTHRVWEQTSRIDLREIVYEIPRQKVITKDNVTMEINALVYYQIVNPEKAVYGVQDLPRAIESLTQTTLRNVIGSIQLDETLVSRDRINTTLRTILDDVTAKWGVNVIRVELQEVSPPDDIARAMEKEMSAERTRRATILTAEGQKQSEILCAEGDAVARLTRAEAEAKSLGVISDALKGKNPAAYLLGTRYIDALPEMAKSAEGKTVVVPYDATSLVGATSMLKEVFEGPSKTE